MFLALSLIARIRAAATAPRCPPLLSTNSEHQCLNPLVASVLDVASQVAEGSEYVTTAVGATHAELCHSWPGYRELQDEATQKVTELCAKEDLFVVERGMPDYAYISPPGYVRTPVPRLPPFCLPRCLPLPVITLPTRGNHRCAHGGCCMRCGPCGSRLLALMDMDMDMVMAHPVAPLLAVGAISPGLPIVRGAATTTSTRVFSSAWPST